MVNSKATLALIALLVASVSVPVLAGGNRGSGHSSAGARGHTGHAGPHRGFVRGPRIGYFAGAPVFASPFYYPPSYYYRPSYYYPPGYYYPQPPPVYIQQPSQPFWYFCPEANGYYPQVQVCPGGWQQVWPEPAGPGPVYPG